MLTHRAERGRGHAGAAVDGADGVRAGSTLSTPGHMSRGERLGVLLTQCASGDLGALGALYDETIGWAYPLVCRAATDTATAEALTKSFYLQVWTDSRHFRQDTDSAVAWVLERLGRHLDSGSQGRQ